MNKLKIHINLLNAVLQICFAVAVTGKLVAQNSSSLSNEEKLSILLKEADKNWHSDISKAKAAAKKAYFLLRPETAPKFKCEAYTQYGIAFYIDLNYDSAIYYYEKASTVAEENNLKTYKYLATTTKAMAKTGRFMDIMNLANKKLSKKKLPPKQVFDLLMLKLSASISLGLTNESYSIIKRAEITIDSTYSEAQRERLTKLKGRYFHLTAAYKKSDSIFSKFLSLYKGTTNQLDLAEMYLLLAQNAMEVSQFDKSSELLIKSQALYSDVAYEFGQAKVDLFTGALLLRMGQFRDATDFVFKSLQTFEKSRNRNEIMRAHYLLGSIFYSMDLTSRSKKYLNKSLKIAQSIHNTAYLCNLHDAFGALYTKLGELDSAIFHFDSALHYQSITENIRTLASINLNKAIALEQMGQDQEALHLYTISYNIDQKIGDILGLIENEWVLGNYYFKNNQLDTAEYYFNKGGERAEELNEKFYRLKILEAQAKLHADKKNNDLAIHYLQKALQVQKELSEKNKTLELATLEITYDLRNKQKELAFLNLQRENNEQTIKLNEKTIESQRNTVLILSIGIILLLILSYIIFRYLKIRTKVNGQLRALYSEIQEKQEEIMAQSEELREANEYVSELNHFLEKRVTKRTVALQNALLELDHFFYRASHDFRGPLTTLLGLINISKSYPLSEEATMLFERVSITVSKLDNMVKKLQSVSFLGDFENLESPRPIDLKSEIGEIANQVITKKLNEYDQNKIDIKIHTDIDSVTFYPSILSICLSNLIENSLVYNYSKIKEVIIKVELVNKDLIITVQDNGTGISKEEQEEIFKMFKRTAQSSPGNGLGLYIVKKAVEKFNGKIKVESETKVGSNFTLSIPLIKIDQKPFTN